MAKIKTTPTPTPTPGPRKTVLTIKGTDEWRAWLERLGGHLRMPASTLVDIALVEFAKSKGFEEVAPKR
jgi:hypothetical protein